MHRALLLPQQVMLSGQFYVDLQMDKICASHAEQQGSLQKDAGSRKDQ
jgi:hypothetical protein